MMYSGSVQLTLSNLWEHININLANATSALFGTKYVETVKIKVRCDGGRQRSSMFTLIHFASTFSSRFTQTVG